MVGKGWFLSYVSLLGVRMGKRLVFINGFLIGVNVKGKDVFFMW